MIFERRCDGVKAIDADCHEVHDRGGPAHDVQADPERIQLDIMVRVRPFLYEISKPKRHTHKPNQQVSHSEGDHEVVCDIPQISAKIERGTHQNITKDCEHNKDSQRNCRERVVFGHSRVCLGCDRPRRWTKKNGSGVVCFLHYVVPFSVASRKILSGL